MLCFHSIFVVPADEVGMERRNDEGPSVREVPTIIWKSKIN